MYFLRAKSITLIFTVSFCFHVVLYILFAGNYEGDIPLLVRWDCEFVITDLYSFIKIIERPISCIVIYKSCILSNLLIQSQFPQIIDYLLYVCVRVAFRTDLPYISVKKMLVWRLSFTRLYQRFQLKYKRAIFCIFIC